jgi:hypothetical protein
VVLRVLDRVGRGASMLAPTDDECM